MGVELYFRDPDVTTFARLDGLGLQVTGQFLEPDRAVLGCRVVDADDVCRGCGSVGVPRDSVLRRLAHEPMGWRPTLLLVTVRRYRCPGCGRVWRQDTLKAAQPRAGCRGAGCGGRWKAWSVGTSPSPGLPKHSGWPGTPPTMLSWLKGNAS